MLSIILQESAVVDEGDDTRKGEMGAMPLRCAQFFRALPAVRLERIESLIVTRSFERGKVLYFERQPARYLWVVRSGAVRLYKGSGDGRMTTLEVLVPGDVFGAVSALRSEQHPSSAEALTTGSAWCLPRNTFMELLKDEPAASSEVLEVVSQRLSEAHERVRALAHDSASSRLAQELLRATEAGEARVTRRELAEAAGTTVETAIRVLRGFERNNLIVGRVGLIRMVDEPAVREIAEQSRPQE